MLIRIEDIERCTASHQVFYLNRCRKPSEQCRKPQTCSQLCNLRNFFLRAVNPSGERDYIAVRTIIKQRRTLNRPNENINFLLRCYFSFELFKL